MVRRVAVSELPADEVAKIDAAARMVVLGRDEMEATLCEIAAVTDGALWAEYGLRQFAYSRIRAEEQRQIAVSQAEQQSRDRQEADRLRKEQAAREVELQRQEDAWRQQRARDSDEAEVLIYGDGDLTSHPLAEISDEDFRVLLARASNHAVRGMLESERRRQAVWANVRRAFADYESHVRLQVTKELLSQTFAMPDGSRVLWGSATVEQHAQRIEMLEKQATGTLQTAGLHRSAIEQIQAAGATSLDGVEIE